MSSGDPKEHRAPALACAAPRLRQLRKVRALHFSQLKTASKKLAPLTSSVFLQFSGPAPPPPRAALVSSRALRQDPKARALEPRGNETAASPLPPSRTQRRGSRVPPFSVLSPHVFQDKGHHDGPAPAWKLNNMLVRDPEKVRRCGGPSDAPITPPSSVMSVKNGKMQKR